MKNLFMFVALALSPAISAQDARQSIASFTLPTPNASELHKLSLWATNYHDYPATSVREGIPLLDVNGKPLGPTLSRRQWCLGSIEGTIRVGTTVYNYAKTMPPLQVDCTKVVNVSVAAIRYGVAKGPYGDGVLNYGLVPWRTIAVDPDTIPYGTLLFIPDAVGQRLPDGHKHDGYFFAADTGSKLKIRGHHIDIFTAESNKPILDFIGSDENDRFFAFIVRDPALINAFQDLHQKWIFEKSEK